MISSSQFVRSLIGALVFSVMAIAQTGVDPVYPYLIVLPDTPYAEKDPVELLLVKGRASNSCRAPTHENVSFSIEKSPLTIYPPLYSVTVSYREIPVPKDRVCPDIYDPVLYGPIFELGLLKEGQYVVIDSGRTLGGFNVTVEGRVPLYVMKGKIVDDPYPLKRMGLPVPKAQIIVTRRVPTPGIVDQSSRPVVSEQPVCTTFTDSNGDFAAKDLARGIYRLNCTHPDFNPVTLGLTLSSDTAVAITMTATSAAAAVRGRVTEVSMVSGMINTVKWVEGCSVQVARPAIFVTDQGTATIEPGLKEVVLTATTDKNGIYDFPTIPIAYNGEKWRVTAFKDGYVSETSLVALYNMQTDTVNFTFQRSFVNSASDTVRGIIFSVATDKVLYTIGEGIASRYAITNTTADTVTFSPFAMQCEYDMAVANPVGKIIFRLSDVTECLESFAPVSITVKPGETVLKTFPVYYLQEVSPSVVSGQIVKLLVFSARLRGEKYDETEVSVEIGVQNARTSVLSSVHARSSTPSIVCSPIRNGIVMNLSDPQTVSFTVYSLDGKINRDRSFKRELRAGSHFFPLTGTADPNRVFIVAVATGAYSKAFKISVDGR
jgi:hypothetical protein